MQYFVYILCSEKNNRFYVGQTEDLEQRLTLHNTGRNISTKAGAPWKMVHFETFSSRSEALAREREIKAKKSRRYLEWLISQQR